MTSIIAIELGVLNMHTVTSKSVRTLLLTAGISIGSMGMATSISADVMLGASLPNDGFSRQVIADFNNVVPKNLAYVNVFSAFSHDWDNLYWQASNVVAEGATPMISWMPIDLQRRDANLLPEIAIGMWDDYLDLWGSKLLSWVKMYPESERPRLAIRFAHEFNGNWYPYSNTPIAYSAAWQHIHDKFGAMGVNDHVDWIWSASKTNVDDYDDFTVYYPGDEYVDWTSLDGYNWGSNYSVNGWSSFGQIFNNAYLELVNNYPEKPIMIAETGSAEPSDLPNLQYGMYGDNSDANESKSAWIGNMLTELESDYPAVRALSMFNINKELGWSVTQEINSGLDAWIDGTQSSHYTADLIVASALGSQGIQSAPLDSDDELALAEIKYQSIIKERGKSKNRLLLSTAGVTKAVVNSDRVSADYSRKNAKAQAQSRLAKSKIPKKIKSNKGRVLSEKIRNLSPKERKQFRKLKIAVIDY